MTAQDAGATFLSRRRAQPKRVEKMQLCVARDLVEQHEEWAVQLSDMGAGNGERLAVAFSEEQRELAQKITELEAEIEANSLWFTFERLDRDRWQAIVDDNPPRQDHFIDLAVEFNRDGVLDDVIHESLIDPVFPDCTGTRVNPETQQREPCTHDDCGTYQEWAKHTPRSEWQDIRNLVNMLNSEVVENPKSELASRILATPGADSAPPAPTG